jgi:hypothetical protein
VVGKLVEEVGGVGRANFGVRGAVRPGSKSGVVRKLMRVLAGRTGPETVLDGTLDVSGGATGFVAAGFGMEPEPGAASEPAFRTRPPEGGRAGAGDEVEESETGGNGAVSAREAADGSLDEAGGADSGVGLKTNPPVGGRAGVGEGWVETGGRGAVSALEADSRAEPEESGAGRRMSRLVGGRLEVEVAWVGGAGSGAVAGFVPVEGGVDVAAGDSDAGRRFRRPVGGRVELSGGIGATVLGRAEGPSVTRNCVGAAPVGRGVGFPGGTSLGMVVDISRKIAKLD